MFGLIDAHRKADAAYKAALKEFNRSLEIHGFEDGSVTKKPCDDAYNSFIAVVETAATTLPGLVAKSAYLQGLAQHEAWMIEQFVGPVQILEGFSASIENISAMA